MAQTHAPLRSGAGVFFRRLAALSSVLTAVAAVAGCEQSAVPSGWDEEEAPTSPAGVSEAIVVGETMLVGFNPTNGEGWQTAGGGASFGMARVWDMTETRPGDNVEVGVTWADVEPNPPVNGQHTYVWGQLDGYMNSIAAAGLRPMYVLYGTPEWAVPASDAQWTQIPAENRPGPGGGARGCRNFYTGACPMYPTGHLDDWREFVRVVAERYKGLRTPGGEGPVYEVWNEPNLQGEPPRRLFAYWLGTDAQFNELTKAAWDVIKQVSPGRQSTVVCCGWNRLAVNARANGQPSAFEAWITGRGARYTDAVSFHPYPSDWNPATAADHTRKFRRVLDDHNVQRTLWATEVGFVNKTRHLSSADEARLVSETIIALRSASVPVVLWYPWESRAPQEEAPGFVGLQPSSRAALAAAGISPDTGACDPATQETSGADALWGNKGGRCLPKCRAVGGTPSTSRCSLLGKVDVGETADTAWCCKPPPNSCDPVTQPATSWDMRDGQCLPRCTALGGTPFPSGSCTGRSMNDAGRSADAAICCLPRGSAGLPAQSLGGCDPVQQPDPVWRVKDGQCLPGCGSLGGTVAFTTPCSQHGKVDAGPAYDVAYCCRDEVSVCDPVLSPSPQWGTRNGQCLPGCGVRGGTVAFETPCSRHGKVDAGPAYDVAYCCKETASSAACDPVTQPFPEWNDRNGQCLQACGLIGGTVAFDTPCSQHGKVDAGPAYDVAYCCKEAASSAVCDPVTQPYPRWDLRDGQCLPGCGVLGGMVAFETPCSQHGKVDAGPAYDVAYCCKETASSAVCDPVTQPAPQWGVKNGQCLLGCGPLGGTTAFATPCSHHGKVEAGEAYDVVYCCQSPCDAASQPAPQWGEKNGQCLQSCGLVGGTVAFTDRCENHGKVDAGPAYDVAYCCADAATTGLCDPASQPAPQWGEKNGQCLLNCGDLGGTVAFTTPCSTHGLSDVGEAYDVAYCCN